MLFFSSFVCGLALAALADAQAINLGTASPYGVFAASTITNTGLTVIGGKIGLSPGTSITGFPPGIASAQDIGNTAATTAKGDIAAAYSALASLAPTADLTGQDLGGMTLGSGVYKFSSSGFLTGTLTLDGQGNPDALFVFQFGSTLITASNSAVVLINGAQACNVYWQVGSSATLGTGTAFTGYVLATASITATTGVSVNGGLYAMTAAVTLDTNAVNPQGNCVGTVATSITDTSTTSATVSPTVNTISATSATVSPTANTVSTTLSTSEIVPTVTSTVTSTVTDPASTTTITATASATGKLLWTYQIPFRY